MLTLRLPSIGLLRTRPDILGRVRMIVKDGPHIDVTYADSVQKHNGLVRLKAV